LKKQNAYESFLVVDGTKKKEEIDEIVSKFRELIKKKASSFDGEDIWGKRKLAYEINRKSEGYYVLYYFTSDTDFPAELERQYRITDGVLRFLVVRNEDGFKPDLTKSLAPRDGIKREKPGKTDKEKSAETVAEAVAEEIVAEAVEEVIAEEVAEAIVEEAVAEAVAEAIVEEVIAEAVEEKETPVVKASEEEKPKRKPRAKKEETVEENSPKEAKDAE